MKKLPFPWLVILVLVAIIVIAGPGTSPAFANPAPFQPGDVFVSVGNGLVKHYDASGTLLETLDIGTGDFTTGCAFDAEENLYVSHYFIFVGLSIMPQQQLEEGGVVVLLGPQDPHTNLGAFGSGYSGWPQSIVFDSDGNVYVGAIGGDDDVRKFDSEGNFLAQFDVETDVLGAGWIDLAPDQRTLFYTSLGQRILRYDVVDEVQLPDLTSSLPVSQATALRILPDGGVMVAGLEVITRLDSSGNVVQTYDVPGDTNWGSLDLDLDSSSFWAGDAYSGKVHKFDIELGGAPILTVDTGAEVGNLQGLCVFGESTTPPPLSPEIDYFALGDSIASGHGLMDDQEACRRSDSAYPHKVAEALATRYEMVNLHFLACSGASALAPDPGFDGDPNKWFPNQVGEVLVGLSDRPALVSITIGANDFGWSRPKNFMSRLYRNSEDKYRAWVDRKAEEVKNSITNMVELLLNHENVVVVLTDYPNPLNTSSILFVGGPGNRCGIFDCYERSEYLVHKLTSIMVEVYVELGRPERLQILTVHPAFHGHESPSPSCGNDAPAVVDTWIQHRDDPDSNSNPKLPGWLKKLTGEWTGDCFHPNETGASVYADAVNEDAQRLGR